MNAKEPSEDGTLSAVRAERGYTLSYHEVMARTEPDLLAAYRNLYARVTLLPRRLPEATRELVWCGLLAIAREEVASIHLERACNALVSPERIGAAIVVATAAMQQSVWRFGLEWFSDYLPEAWWEHATNASSVSAAAGLLDDHERLLVELVAHACLQNRCAFVYTLARGHAAGLSDGEMAEALSYLLLPRGANALLWATDVWVDAVAAGEVGSSGPVASIDVETRRR